MRATAYSLLSTGGGVLLSDPTRSLQSASIQIRWVWSTVLVVGCIAAIIGAVRDRYLAEFAGLPFIMAGMIAFVVVLAAGRTSPGIAIACFLSAIVVILASRFMDLWELVTVTDRAERRRK